MDPAIPFVVDRALVGLLVLGSGLWLGGFVTIAIVSATSRNTIGAAERIALFRGLGRRYAVVAAVALALVAVPGGVLLLAVRPLDGFTLAILVVAFGLVVVAAVAVRQARRMTRMRSAALADPRDATRAAAIARNARIAKTLRITIGVVSVALFVLALATP